MDTLPLDDEWHRIDATVLPFPLPSRPLSAASISNRDRAAAIECARCRGAGRLLETEERAEGEGLIVLDRRVILDRRLVEVPCSCDAARDIIARWRQLPPDAEGVALDTLFDIPEQDEAFAKAEAFCLEPRGWLTLAGNYGVGKTALLYAILNRLADSGRFGRYTAAPDLIDKLRSLIRDGGDPDQCLQRWIDAPLIAIDEIDKYDATEFSEKTIFRLFHARYQRWPTTGTLLAYNQDREDRLPPFLRSRMRDGRFHFVVLAGSDVRPGLGDPWDRGETQ